MDSDAKTFDKLRHWLEEGYPDQRCIEIVAPTKYAASAWMVTLVGKKKITVEECAFICDEDGDIGEGEHPSRPGEYWYAAHTGKGYPFIGLAACIDLALKKAEELGA